MAGAEVIELVVSWGVTNALTFVAVILDERRSSEDRLERAWPPVSRDAAILSFGLFALPIHFARTRGDLRSLRGVGGILVGLGLGLLVATAVAALAGALDMAIFTLAGLPTD